MLSPINYYIQKRHIYIYIYIQYKIHQKISQTHQQHISNIGTTISKTTHINQRIRPPTPLKIDPARPEDHFTQSFTQNGRDSARFVPNMWFRKISFFFKNGLSQAASKISLFRSGGVENRPFQVKRTSFDRFRPRVGVKGFGTQICYRVYKTPHVVLKQLS